MLTRRDFLRAMAIASVAAGAAAPLNALATAPKFKEAGNYDKAGGGRIKCRLCPRRCELSPGDSGFCRARKNLDGVLYTLGYASPCAVHVDPIEKKPLFHFMPKSYAFSIASAGCNLRCKFCQNWEISQVSPEETENYYAPPERLPAMAKESGCLSLAYTYSEPTSFYEYMLDTAKAARTAGIKNVYHSNGFINPAPLKELCRHMDGANVDLKGFTDKYYGDMCEAELGPVLESLKNIKRSGVWLEITNLTIPGYNDDPKTVRAMAGWIASELGPETPLHFSRFFPLYKLTSVPPTPVETLVRSRDVAMKAGLEFVYIGNVPGHEGENTYCPKCRKLLVRRSGFSVLEENIKGGKCYSCGRKVAGVWQE